MPSLTPLRLSSSLSVMTLRVMMSETSLSLSMVTSLEAYFRRAARARNRAGQITTDHAGLAGRAGREDAPASGVPRQAKWFARRHRAGGRPRAADLRLLWSRSGPERRRETRCGLEGDHRRLLRRLSKAPRRGASTAPRGWARVRAHGAFARARVAA